MSYQPLNATTITRSDKNIVTLLKTKQFVYRCALQITCVEEWCSNALSQIFNQLQSVVQNLVSASSHVLMESVLLTVQV